MSFKFSEDLEAIITAGIVAQVRTARSGGTFNQDFLLGALSAYEHEALAANLDWESICASAVEILGSIWGDKLLSALEFMQNGYFIAS